MNIREMNIIVAYVTLVTKCKYATGMRNWRKYIHDLENFGMIRS